MKGASEISEVVGVGSVSDAGAASALRRLLVERIAVLDGAWGTMLQGAQLTPPTTAGT
jgi:5-methyltetrahydrofolate--homocysteine methyltransferase